MMSTTQPLVEHRASVIALESDPLPLVAAVITPPVVRDARGRGMKDAVRPTHPDCGSCCAVRLCHWCFEPARSSIFGAGYLVLQWPIDGLWYGACPTHHQDLRAMMRGDVSPNAIGAGLR